MESFAELEDRYRLTPVQGEKDGAIASGVLTLDREKTTVVLTCTKPVGYPYDRNGWFNLHLKGSNGVSILLHNALHTQSITHGMKDRQFEEHIFPNAIVFGADKLAKDGRLGSISFCLNKLRYFFWYEHFEWQSLYKATPQQLASLRRLRRDQERRYDFFHPLELYVIHQPRRVLRFKAGDSTYEIFSGYSSKGGGWSDLNLKAEPSARNTFDTPVSIDDAVNRIWTWKRFFSQVAMQTLSVEAISAGTRRRRYPEATLYLPYARVNSQENSYPGDFHPGDAPLNRWRDRGALAEVMQRWLSKEERRRQFRISVDDVVENMRKRASITDIVTLCSAIEGLSELNEKTALSDAQIEVIVCGAAAAATASSIEVTPDRLRGLLKMLQHQSLPRKMNLLYGFRVISSG
jgi:ApeA N-terminal domain 1